MAVLVDVADAHAEPLPVGSNLRGALPAVVPSPPHLPRERAGVESLEACVDVRRGDGGVGDKVEHLPHRGHRHLRLCEELTEVEQVLPEKVEAPRVVQVDGLGHVDDVRVTVVVQDVVLGEVRVHQPAFLVHPPHVDEELAEELTAFAGAETRGVLQPRRRHAVIPDEPHHEHVRSQQFHLWHPEANLS